MCVVCLLPIFVFLNHMRAHLLTPIKRNGGPATCFHKRPPDSPPPPVFFSEETRKKQTHTREELPLTNNQMNVLVAFLMGIYLAVGPISVNYNSEKNYRVLSTPLYWREFQTAAAGYWDSLHLPGGKRSSDLWADINCAVQFHSHESRRYCECVTQRQDTLWCRFPCHCTELPLSNCTAVPCAETICESATCGTGSGPYFCFPLYPT